MDWTLALQRNHEILLRNVAWLFTWLGLAVGESVETLPDYKRRTVLFVLRPSESALRRLILVAVHVWKTKASALVQRAVAAGQKKREAKEAGSAPQTPPAFRLIDPRKRFDLNPNQPKRAKGPGPWITDLWSDNPPDRSVLYAYQEKLKRRKETTDSAVTLCRRLNAAMAALNDLPAQAQRMARLQARLDQQAERTDRPKLTPLRPGTPPGFRKRQLHEVDDVLADCHTLARWTLDPPDSS